MFEPPNRSVPESDLSGHLERNQIREMKQLEELLQLLRPLPIGSGLMVGLAIEDDEVIGDIPQRPDPDNAEHRIGEETLVHDEVDDFEFLMGISEERDRVSLLIVRQEQPSRGPDELRYAQPVAGLDAPRLHEGLLREQPFHTSVG